MKPNTVQKMLSPEETSLLQDVMAGLNVLLASNNAGSVEETTEGTGAQTVAMGEGMTPEEEANKQEANPDDMETSDDYDEAKKSNDGPTANPQDKAEERVEDGTDLTDANVSTLAKALMSLAGKKAPVKKSAEQNAADVLVKALQPVMSRMSTIEKDMNAMLEALGFSEAMDSVEKTENPINVVQKSAQGKFSNASPVTNPDTMDLIKMIAASVAQEVTKGQGIHDENIPRPNYSNPRTEAHKALGKAVHDVFKGA